MIELLGQIAPEVGATHWTTALWAGVAVFAVRVALDALVKVKSLRRANGVEPGASAVCQRHSVGIAVQANEIEGLKEAFAEIRRELRDIKHMLGARGLRCKEGGG